MCQTHCQTTECEQMQRVNQNQGINVQGWTEPLLCAVVCWWRHRCLVVDNREHSTLISWMLEATLRRGREAIRKQEDEEWMRRKSQE